ncbi:MAG: aryl-sulfate sulfotransferase [Syntrophothermus sp.]
MSRKLLFTAVFICFPLLAQLQNFPPLQVTINDSSATRGYYFFSPYTSAMTNPYDPSHQILDQFGRLVFYQLLPPVNLNPTIDFKLQPDGRISYFDTHTYTWIFMDSTFTIVDSLQGAGFQGDLHDIQILSNGHYLLLAKESRMMDLSAYHWFGFTHNQPGSANAQVTGVVIQELDQNKQLIWEWKSFDHFAFADVDERWLFSPSKVDWTHANAVEPDKDGNILLSCRHLNEITKIDRTTGNIIWRLGGKQNQFTFTNDPVRFTGQHDIRRVNDSCITLFDNGQLTTPAVARALEYSLNETTRVATLVWEYIEDSSMYSAAMGNQQINEFGNHIIDYGSWPQENPFMTVVKPDKSKIIEFTMPVKVFSYRSFNYPTLPWQLKRPQVECQKTGNDYYLVAEPGHASYRWSTGETTASVKITAPGEYYVWVPYGVGYLCSERIMVTDLSHPCIVAGVSSPVEGILLDFRPNPAEDHLNIRFVLQEKEHVTLTLQNNFGITVMKPADKQYPAGNNELTIDVSSLASGAYLLTMRTDTGIITKKIIIR